MKTLDPIALPLNQSCLIEASAGTGKTYTMANLYLRLILGVGCEPLSVEQILVVTFTKASTQELRDRIRSKLGNVAKWFQSPDTSEAMQALRDPFLYQLYQAVLPERGKALLRLRIAERDMDLAAIYTIDSFCQKMLFQYAFDSGVRFDLDLQTDERELLKTLSEAVWRERFYPADSAKTALISHILISPDYALTQVSQYLSGILPPLSEAQKKWLYTDYSQQYQAYTTFLSQVKQYWLAHQVDILAPLQHHFEQNLATLNATSYKAEYLIKWQATLERWANSMQTEFMADPLNRFSQSFLEQKTKKGKSVIQSPHYVQIEQFITRFEQEFASLSNQIRTQIIYEYFEAVRQKLDEYKQHHTEKNFTDMLTYFHHALFSEKGQILAAKIRQQFKFAMIDESQDTNQVQYDIFKAIFMPQGGEHGFIMIGDPKQSIYKFRGADIFSYLSAAKEVTLHFTLSKNWRSLPAIVEGVNRLFDFGSSEQPPFLYPEIRFQTVDHKQTETALLGKQQAWNIYLQPQAYHRGHFKSDLAAEQCAAQIQQQLTQAAQGELFVSEEQEMETENGLQKSRVSRPLVAQDIAILVRSHSDAQRIKHALAKRRIQSVYLSEDSSVYQSQEAADLAFILAACLNPYQSKTLLSALATPLWGLTAAELYRLKNSESEWENYVEDFIRYHQIWRNEGILPMIHRLVMQQGVISRLNSSNYAERRMTNLLHLSELLQAEQERCENEFALLRWFNQRIEIPSGGDEQILRLESEEKLIKIVTIHKSKGLEYPVVWLPFIAKKSLGAESKAMSLYRDAQHQLHWDFNSEDETIKQLKNTAEYAEDLRLLYVALTRAKYQLHLILPTQFSSSWNAMHYLLTNGQLSKETQTEAALSAKAIGAKLHYLNESFPAVNEYRSSNEAELAPQAKVFNGIIRKKGVLTSFTALQMQNERLHAFYENQPLAVTDEAQDYDRTPLIQPISNEAEEMQFSPYDFPHSTKVGNVLHKFFEGWDFTSPLERAEIDKLCESLQLASEWVEPIIQWFETIVATPFTDGICLNQCEPDKRLNEWQFCLRLSNEKALPQLNRLLKAESRLAKQLPDLQLKQLEGFVRGFVDLIVEQAGKFYLIDYKSNYLGRFSQDYLPEQLEKTMGQYRYDLQYLLYTLALHRYLRSRLGESYNYEQHFGGVAYLFLRGMNGEAQGGVYFDKPTFRLIDEMDRLFA